MDKILALTLKAPHALKGAVKALCVLDDVELLLDTPLHDAGGKSYTVQRLQQGAGGLLIVHLEGVTTPEAAAALKGVQLFLNRADLAETGGDEVYLGDLIGREVVATGGQLLGKVVALRATPAHELLEVQPAVGKSFYIPAEPEFVVDLTAEVLMLTELGVQLATI